MDGLLGGCGVVTGFLIGYGVVVGDGFGVITTVGDDGLSYSYGGGGGFAI